MATLNKWSGYFNSETYLFYSLSFVKGTIEVELGEPGTDYKSTFCMTYTGSYRHNRKVSGDLNVKGNTFTCYLDGMQITFKVTTRTEKKITGTYKIGNLFDQGTFTLDKC